MERPQIYFFLLPLTLLTLILYIKLLFALWKRRASYNTLFYKLIRTQAIFDISYVIVFFLFEIPLDWPQFDDFLFSLNNTHWVQLMYAHAFFCVNGQVLGVTLNSIGRVLMVRYSTKSISKITDELSTPWVIIILMTPPAIFGLYIFFGQTPSHFEFVPHLNRMTRVTDVNYVQINSIITMFTSITGALISSFCYILIFFTLKKRPYRCWNREASILFTSFILFLCLCSIAVYYLFNGLFSIINWDAMFDLRINYYAFSFPISLLNPWCLLLTSPRMRKDVLGRKLSQTAVMRLLPSRTPHRNGVADMRGNSSSSNK